MISSKKIPIANGQSSQSPSTCISKTKWAVNKWIFHTEFTVLHIFFADRILALGESDKNATPSSIVALVCPTEFPFLVYVICSLEFLSLSLYICIFYVPSPSLFNIGRWTDRLFQNFRPLKSAHVHEVFFRKVWTFHFEFCSLLTAICIVNIFSRFRFPIWPSLKNEDVETINGFLLFHS